MEEMGEVMNVEEGAGEDEEEMEGCGEEAMVG